MSRSLLLLALVSGLLFALTGCEKKSRFDDKKTVDLCAVIGAAEARDILGPLTEEPKSEPASPGIAGTCIWRFKSNTAGIDGKLTAMLVTEASNAMPLSIGRWFSENLKEMKASLDPHPVALKTLGDRAFLYQISKPDYSAIAMQQGRTCAILRIQGASSSQLERFAAILASQAQARDTPDALGNQKVTNVAATTTKADANPSQPSATARDDAGHGKDDGTRVLYTMGYVEQCIRVDNLLRKSCARWRDQLSEKNRQYCDLPAAPFEARTADNYRAFQQAYGTRIHELEPKLAHVLAQGRTAFEQQYAKALTGSISGLELESLNNQLGRECAAVEAEWLPARSDR